MKLNGEVKRCGVVVGVLLLSILSMGCAGYGNYPTSNGYKVMDSPNSPHMSEVIRRAVVAAVDRAGISGPYAIRLPEGMDSTRSDRVLKALDDANARLVDGENTYGLPEFVVERVIVRVNHAEVDVAIPMAGVEWSDGTVAQQLTTYYLKSGFGRWRVTRMRTWSIGVTERATADVDRAAEEIEAGVVVTEEKETEGMDEPPF